MGLVPIRPRLELCYPPPHDVTLPLLPTLNTGSNACDTTKGRLNFGTDRGAAVRERRGGVVLDDVSDFRVCL